MLCCAVFLLAGALCFPPRPRTAAATERFPIVWEDGTVQEASYAEAYAALCGCTEREILFLQNGKRGSVSAGENFGREYRLLSEGDLAGLLREDGALNALEKLALYRKFGGTGYYSEEFFAYGDGFGRTERKGFSEVMLLTGNIPADVLRETGAKKLTVCKDARLKAEALTGTQIAEFGTFAPYYAEGGVLYLETAGGTRLVAALPAAETLEAGNAYFADSGALCCCTRLSSLTLPFLGSALSPAGSGRDGRLAYLFAEEVPASLKRVKVTGGTVSAFAFEGCEHVEEIDLCGAERVSPDAFAGCYGLKKLHTSQQNVNLAGQYSVQELPCGCFLYEREEA